MEEIREAIIINEVMDDVYPNINIIGNVTLGFAEPLILQNQAIQREAVPGNDVYFEVTISQYMGDFFIEHFRMSKRAFEQLTSIILVEKNLLFSLWILAKPESFLAAGDRFELAKSTAYNVFNL
ncbi:hypothetical protein MML48_10g00011629 [Holotrichia oblita]|uniref:Uncharacterized protein n=2 Tax=Holotrichia oblita TaxID=644536 RepID=A0ACB9SHX8_HOLOL|nr:hypothetical protein MML48_10g00005560 [Holotrichia oblita]KAI4454210.1 hypothetical protein MML48_10g00011629 [Holotrichia oblita]